MRLRMILTYRTMEGTYERLEHEADDFAVSNDALQRLALSKLPRQATLTSLKIEASQPTFDDLMLDAILGTNHRTSNHIY